MGQQPRRPAPGVVGEDTNHGGERVGLIHDLPGVADEDSSHDDQHREWLVRTAATTISTGSGW